MKNKEIAWHHHAERGRSAAEISDKALELRNKLDGFIESDVRPTVQSWDTKKVLDYQLDEVIDLINRFYTITNITIEVYPIFKDLILRACEQELGRKFAPDELEYIEDDF